MNTNYRNTHLSLEDLSAAEEDLLQRLCEEPRNGVLLKELRSVQDALAEVKEAFDALDRQEAEAELLARAEAEARDMAADGWSEQSCW